MKIKADSRKAFKSSDEVVKQLDKSYEGRGINTQPDGSVWEPARKKDYKGLVKPTGRTPEEEKRGLDMIKKLQAMKLGDSIVVADIDDALEDFIDEHGINDLKEKISDVLEKKAKEFDR